MRAASENLIWLAQAIYELGQREEDSYWVPYAKGVLTAVEYSYGTDARTELLGKLDEWQRNALASPHA